MGPSTEMHSRVKRGVAWTGGSQISAQLIRLAGAIVVARLLTPAEYGLAMLALVFASLVLVFSDLALGAALVQRKELSERDRSTAFWVTIAGGALFTLAGAALSGPVASLYGEPDAQPLLAALSASFILTAVGATQQALLLRDMAFARLELMTLASTLVGVLGAVLVAAAGGGAWAIIAQQLVAAIVASVLFWFVSPWRPKLVVLAREHARPVGLQRLPRGPPPALLPASERRPVPHRALDWGGRPGCLCGRLQRDAGPGQPDWRPGPARARPRVRAHAGRAGAHRRRLGARDPPHRRDHHPRACGAGRRGARLRAGRAGRAVAAGDPDCPDPCLGGGTAGPPDGQRGHPDGPRPHLDAASATPWASRWRTSSPS